MMPMRICAKCAKPTQGEKIHPGCEVPRPYNDRVHVAISRWYRMSETPCSNCGVTGTRDNPIEAHHITPVEHGGTTEPGNYQALCRRCNATQGSRRGTE